MGIYKRYIEKIPEALFLFISILINEMSVDYLTHITRTEKYFFAMFIGKSQYEKSSLYRILLPFTFSAINHHYCTILLNAMYYRHII